MIAFTNTSTGGNSFKWYFGDGDSSFLNNPNHGYSSCKMFIFIKYLLLMIVGKPILSQVMLH